MVLRGEYDRRPDQSSLVFSPFIVFRSHHLLALDASAIFSSVARLNVKAVPAASLSNVSFTIRRRKPL